MPGDSVPLVVPVRLKIDDAPLREIERRVQELEARREALMGTRVRMKFHVNSVTQISYGKGAGVTGEIVQATPVYSFDENDENHRYWKASPSGEFKIQIDNPAAFGVFIPGNEYYLDVSDA